MTRRIKASSVATLKGSKHPHEALAILNGEANIYPAAKADADLPVLTGCRDLYGGKGTLTDALSSAQKSTVSTLESQSIPVAK